MARGSATEAMAPSKLLLAAVIRILRPLVRMLLRHGVPYPAFSELARWTYAEVAARDFPIPGRKQTHSRISVLTGLSRKEVLRLRQLPEPGADGEIERFNRAARIVSAWARESEFCEAGGQPRALPLEGESPSFAELVARFGGDVTPRAVLDELLRVGTVERDGDGGVRLRSRAYVPAGDDAEAGRLAILGHDVAALVETIDHNLQADGGERWFQRRVAYEGVPAGEVSGVRDLASADGQRLLELLDRVLAEKIRRGYEDGPPAQTSRVMLGIYWHEEPEPPSREPEVRGRRAGRGRKASR